MTLAAILDKETKILFKVYIFAVLASILHTETEMLAENGGHFIFRRGNFCLKPKKMHIVAETAAILIKNAVFLT